MGGSFLNKLFKGNFCVHLRLPGKSQRLGDIIGDAVVIFVGQNGTIGLHRGQVSLIIRNVGRLQHQIFQFALFLVKPLEHIRTHHHFFELLGVFELKIGLHESYSDNSLVLLKTLNDLVALHVTIVNVAIVIEFHIPVAKVSQERLGLLLQLGGALSHFLDDLHVGQVFKPVVNVRPLLMHAHEFLGAGQKGFVQLSEGGTLGERFAALVDLVEHGLVINERIVLAHVLAGQRDDILN